MRQDIGRTLLALALIVVAVAVPCVKWYYVGSRETEMEAERIMKEPRWEAESTAVRLAVRIGSRLESLRETESRRPFYHYQSLYHDPKGASEGASVVPSPLAQGPAHPQVRAHFQINAAGRVTLPTLNEAVPDLAPPEQAAAQRAVQQELQAAAALCWDKLRERRPADASVAVEPARTEEMDAASYEQNLRASQLYAEIKSGRTTPREPRAASPRGEVRVIVGPFRWHTVTTGHGDALVALRGIRTPHETLAQGFMVDPRGVAEFLKGASFPARFVAGASAGANAVEAPVRIAPAAWRVAVAADHALAEAADRVRELRESFLESFLAGVFAAATAGLCVVLLVWQTERLARQRSQFAASAAQGDPRVPFIGLATLAMNFGQVFDPELVRSAWMQNSSVGHVQEVPYLSDGLPEWMESGTESVVEPGNSSAAK